MTRHALGRLPRPRAAVPCLLICLLLTSCQLLPLAQDGDCLGTDDCHGRAKVCTSPTVQALACDLDRLERHIEKYGSVVAQHPDVWGQARLTKHREDYENQMSAELDKFTFTLQGSLARSDQAYAADAFALSSAAAAAAQGKSKGSSAAAVVSNHHTTAEPSATGRHVTTTSAHPAGSTVVQSMDAKQKAPARKGTGKGAAKDGSKDGNGGSADGGLPDQSDTFAAFGSITRTDTGTVTGPTYTFLGNNGINVEPAVYLDQKSRYLNHLNELRRISEGDDTADSPGYALNLVRIPVSILPGKCTDVGHGAEITMTLTPHLSEELLPTAFRNLVVNDLVEQIAYPVTQFINNPDNWVYLDDRKLSGDLYHDVTELFRFADNNLGIILYALEKIGTVSFVPLNKEEKAAMTELSARYGENIAILKSLRHKLSLQPLFARPEWNWVEAVLSDERIERDFGQLLPDNLREALETLRSEKADPAASKKSQELLKKQKDLVLETRAAFFERYAGKINAFRSSMYQNVLVPATKSRRAALPFPPAQMVEVYGYDLTYELAVEAYRGLFKERFTRPCPGSEQVYIHMPDIQGYLQEELSGVYKLLASPTACHLWQTYCTEDLAVAVRSHQTERLKAMRQGFKKDLATVVKSGAPAGVTAAVREVTVALAWAMIVESALLNQQLIQDMKESAVAKGWARPLEGWQPYFLPDPPPEARAAFNEYVRCRWPIHVFALDPVNQQQNISDVYSSRREMQLAMSLAFVGGKISARNMMRYARRIEFDMATIDLNNTQVGFSHGDDTFGWRFYPRFQSPDVESNATVFFRDLLVGGPRRNALLHQRRLEPGQRECIAIVIMPSFVPYADLTVTSNWFSLTNPNCKMMDSQFAMRLSKSVRAIEKCGPNAFDADCYRDGDLIGLLQKAQQLSRRLPIQLTTVQIPYENTLGGFGMFNTGVTDLAPELNGWYGSPSINPNQNTTIFLVGNHFSVHQTRVIAAGNEITDKELLSRQVMRVVIPPYPNLIGSDQKFVDIHVATPYGVTQHLLVPVCVAPCPLPCPPPPGEGKTPPGAAADALPAITDYAPTPAPTKLPSPAPSQEPGTKASPKGGAKKKAHDTEAGPAGSKTSHAAHRLPVVAAAELQWRDLGTARLVATANVSVAKREGATERTAAPRFSGFAKNPRPGLTGYLRQGTSMHLISPSFI